MFLSSDYLPVMISGPGGSDQITKSLKIQIYFSLNVPITMVNNIGLMKRYRTGYVPEKDWKCALSVEQGGRMFNWSLSTKNLLRLTQFTLNSLGSIILKLKFNSIQLRIQGFSLVKSKRLWQEKSWRHLYSVIEFIANKCVADYKVHIIK